LEDSLLEVSIIQAKLNSQLTRFQKKETSELFFATRFFPGFSELKKMCYLAKSVMKETHILERYEVHKEGNLQQGNNKSYQNCEQHILAFKTQENYKDVKFIKMKTRQSCQ
jgi:hypothetical protein